MINVAEGNYPNGQLFTTPWNFWVIDNFLNQQAFENILNMKDNPNIFEVVDSSNGKRVVTSGKFNKYDFKIREKSHLELFNQLQESAHQSLLKVINSEELNKLYYIIDLVYCEPQYAYQKHLDHPDKFYSIVVYLHPEHADATTLLDSDNKLYNVVWKPNRALIFKTNKQAYHFYRNKQQEKRYSLNIYLTKEKISFDVSTRGAVEHSLDKYTA